MFVKHEFTSEQFQFLIDMANEQGTSVKSLIKKSFREYVSDQMEEQTNVRPKAHGDQG